MSYKTIKKLSKMGTGAGILLNKEMNVLGWKQGEFVSVEADKEKLVIRKVNY